MADSTPRAGDAAARRRRTSKRLGLVIALVSVASEALMLRSRGYGLGGSVVVRCRRRRLFTTIWIPGASVTSIRLGWWRIQWCPVGRHFSLVSPVAVGDMSLEDREEAAAIHDLRLP